MYGIAVHVKRFIPDPGVTEVQSSSWDLAAVGVHVKSGFQIAGLTILAFCSFIALGIGLQLATGRVESGGTDHRLLGAIVVVGMMAFLYGTVRYWARWLVGILVLSLWRLWGGLMFKGFFELPTSVTFTALLAWSLYALAAFALTVRHASRVPVGAEKFGLVCFVVCVALAMVSSSSSPLFYGLGLLAVGELLQRLMSHRRHQAHPDLTSAQPFDN
jgi:hypothetical protein